MVNVSVNMNSEIFGNEVGEHEELTAYPRRRAATIGGLDSSSRQSRIPLRNRVCKADFCGGMSSRWLICRNKALNSARPEDEI